MIAANQRSDRLFTSTDYDGGHVTSLALNEENYNNNCSDSLHEKTKHTSERLRNVSMGSLFSRLVQHARPNQKGVVQTRIPDTPNICDVWGCLKTIVSFSDLLVEKLTAPLELFAIALQSTIGGENVIRLSRLVIRILATAALILALSGAYFGGWTVTAIVGVAVGLALLVGYLFWEGAKLVGQGAKQVGLGIYKYIIKPLGKPCNDYIAYPLYFACAKICTLVSTPFCFIANELHKRHLRANKHDYLAAQVQLLNAEVAVLRNQDNDLLKNAYKAANYNFEQMKGKFKPIINELNNMGQHGSLTNEQKSAIFNFAGIGNDEIAKGIISKIDNLNKKDKEEVINKCFENNIDGNIDFDKNEYDQLMSNSKNTTLFSSFFGRSTTTANTTSSNNLNTTIGNESSRAESLTYGSNDEDV
jgi:hypothetical protein